MNAKQAISAVLRRRWRRNFCLPTYTPAGWWECDVFELTPAGYWREYEVKLTAADFRKDALKEKSFGWRRPAENKHELLAARSTRGPQRFWFVTPAGLIAPDKLPDWAGLIELSIRADQWLFPQEVRSAPKLHGERCSDAIMKHARGICYWRMHDLLNRQKHEAAG